MVFHSHSGKEFHDLVNYLLTTLKKRSKYVIATQDYKSTGSSSFMELYKGDLITLTENNSGETLEYNSWGEGVNDRSGETGNFPTDSVTIVPTMIKPPPSIINILKEGASIVPRSAGFQTVQRLKLYTLESYAAENFRVAIRKSTVSKGRTLTSVRENTTETLWAHSRDPIKRPLLQKLNNDEELSAQACMSFVAILKYMGDQPTRKQNIGTEYTDKIFDFALKNVKKIF